MRRRIFQAFGFAVVMTALAAFLQSAVSGQAPAPGGAAGTASTGNAKAGPAPRTPWGHPDLQGIWLDEFDTPFERPAQYADKEFFTEEERTARDEKATADAGRNERANRGSAQDVAGATTRCLHPRSRPAVARPWWWTHPTDVSPIARRRPGTQPDRSGVPPRAPAEHTDLQEPGAGCRGGKYGPPSPRLKEQSPFYNTQRMNRHNGLKIRAWATGACLEPRPISWVPPHRPGPNVIAIGIDTGQGQGYQRIVYLGGSHPPKSVHLRHGDSRGRFEGQTLVVETTNFSPKFPYRGAGENLTLVERFTRLDAKTLEYSATMTDATLWTAPWTVKQELTMQSDEQNRIYYEPRCHEGNYGLPSLLVGARLETRPSGKGRDRIRRSRDTATCVNELPAEREN
jgi:hypothetical protein